MGCSCCAAASNAGSGDGSWSRSSATCTDCDCDRWDIKRCDEWIRPSALGAAGADVVSCFDTLLWTTSVIPARDAGVAVESVVAGTPVAPRIPAGLDGRGASEDLPISSSSISDFLSSSCLLDRGIERGRRCGTLALAHSIPQLALSIHHLQCPFMRPFIRRIAPHVQKNMS